MTKDTDLAVAILISGIGVWFFADALWNSQEQKELLYQKFLAETKVNCKEEHHD